MTRQNSMAIRRAALVAAGLAFPLGLGGCIDQMDFDMRGGLGGLDTAQAVQVETAPRPEPDARGVISYTGYQVAVARRGDTVSDVAARIGLAPDALARFNGIAVDASLRDGELLALPSRVAATDQPTTSGVDIAALASNAIDRAELDDPVAPQTAPQDRAAEPIRHKVARGETAYSISRLYGVTVRALADWNALGPDLKVREGQFLLIPLVLPSDPEKADTAPPGTGSRIAPPPSAATALPPDDTATPVAPPSSPDLGQYRTVTSARFAMPVDGKIIRSFSPGKSEGLDIAGAPGGPVTAAADGRVAAVTRDTDRVTILVVEHDDGFLTVYGNIDGVQVAKGDRVTRGQAMAVLPAGTTPVLHFQVIDGATPVDPADYLG